MSKSHRFLVSVLFCCQSLLLLAQETPITPFIELDIMPGIVVPNVPNFPNTKLNQTYQLSIGKTNLTNKHWVEYYNLPSYGVSLSYSSFGNPKQLGEEYSALLFLELSPQKNSLQSWFFRFAIGPSYFTKHFESLSNETNTIIGSHWNWKFQAFLYKKIKDYERLNLRLGAGYLHSSNGHTQIPNYGMNSALLSLSARFYQNKNPYASAKVRSLSSQNKKSKSSFVQLRTGLGMHELGSTTEPIGGPKKGVYSAAINYGILFNQQFKLRCGLSYRYYQHYYDQLIKSNGEELTANRWNASNLYFLAGIEYLIHHFAIDVEGGLNLHKPYYEIFYREFENAGGIKEFMKKTFNSRLGLNYYLINPSKQSDLNLFLGASINANFGQADFSQLNIGVYKKITAE